MLKFFRSFRQNIFAEDKTGRYLKYAIGEIVLVVIGILIALQINNWNEGRQSAKFERQLLVSFKNGLSEDLADIEGNIRIHQRAIAAVDSILYALESETPFAVDTLARLFADLMTPTYFQHSTSAFETLKSKGITTIANEPLRDQIIGVYDSQYKFFLKFEEAHMSEIERGATAVFPTRFKESYNYDLSKPGFPGYLYPLNFESLKTDQEFLYYLKSLRNRTRILIEFQYALLKGKVVALLSAIEGEIALRPS